MLPARALVAIACSGLAACAHMLPESSVDTGSELKSYEQARTAFARIEPYKTRLGELKPIGFDPQGNRNVRLIPYPDLVGRLVPNAAIGLADLDPGIRDCILARTACQAYEFRLAHEVRERKGGFLKDFLNFERTTVVTGWRFEALIVVRDDVVLFRNFSGEPDNIRIEHQSNPLGPLQSSGESLGEFVAR